MKCNNNSNDGYRTPPKQTNDWTVLGNGKSCNRVESDAAMRGQRWTIDWTYNCGKSYQRFVEGLNK